MQSSNNGKKFLQESFSREQELLMSKLNMSTQSVTHSGKMGEVNEGHVIRILRAYLPDRYSVDSAIVIDSKGKTSEQIDVVIYDHHFTPTLLDQYEHRYIPAEAVYAVFEVKPELSKEYLVYAGAKAASVRNLFRTSAIIQHIEGQASKKEPFNIVAGIISARNGWKDGVNSQSFKLWHKALREDEYLDCGLSVEGSSFDTFDQSGDFIFGPKSNALVFFLFRFMRKLQLMGSSQPADWNLYAQQLSSEEK